MTTRVLIQLALMLCLLVTLASCGESSITPPSQSQGVVSSSDGSSSTDNSNNDSEASTSQSKNDSVVSSTQSKNDVEDENVDIPQPKTTITEEEWNKFMSLEGIDSFTITFDYLRTTADENNELVQHTKTEGLYKYYNGKALNNGMTCKGNNPMEPFLDIACKSVDSISDIELRPSLFEDYFEKFNIKYSDLTYDEDKKAYRHEQSIENTTFVTYYSFSNTELTKITISLSLMLDTTLADTWDLSCEFSNWNSTDFEFPTDEIMEQLSVIENATSVTVHNESFEELDKQLLAEDLKQYVAGLTIDKIEGWGRNTYITLLADTITLGGESLRFISAYMYIEYGNITQLSLLTPGYNQISIRILY